MKDIGFLYNGKQITVRAANQTTPPTPFDVEFVKGYVARNIDSLRESFENTHKCSKCPQYDKNFDDSRSEDCKRQEKHVEDSFWLRAASGQLFKI